MHISFAEHLDHPVLAVDMGGRVLRALLYAPGPTAATCGSSSKIHDPASEANGRPAGESTLYAFALPSPERMLAEQLKHHTALGHSVHLDCPVAAGGCAAAIEAHLASGAGLSLHPETAATLGPEADWPETLRAGVAHRPSVQAVVLRDAGFSPLLWRSLLAGLGLPLPDVVLAGALERDSVFPAWNEAECGRPRSRERLWSLSRSGGIAVSELAAAPAREDLLRLRAIQRITGYPALDSSAAFLLGLLSMPGVRERSYRQGVTLLFMGKTVISAGLVFQDRLFGFFELPADRLWPKDAPEPALLLTCLEEFRLGWLPKEMAARLGGFADSALALPPEAEGFRPVYATGPHASLARTIGQIPGTPEDIALNNCRGLIHGYARMRAKTASLGVGGHA